MTTQAPIIGIDFGTSKSCMAWFNPKTQQAEVLMNTEGEHKTPSVVYFGDGDEMLVGSPAEAMLEDESDRWRVVRSVKRDLVSAPTLSLPGRKRVKPVEVAAAILRKLRLDAEKGHFHQPVLKAVITCPAEFGALEREAIAKAGKLAGFEEVALLEEPVAAGLAYQRAGLAVGDHVLVYDLGGGTFDLAVLMRDAEQGYRLALEPQGETRCGGDDFDRALYDYCDQVVEETLGRSIAPDGKVDPDFLRECREAKEALTAQAQVRVNTYLAAEDRPVRFKHLLERAVFEELVRERVETTVRLTQTLLQRAQASGVAVDTVVLIGGSARVPLVIQQLAAALPVAPQFWEKQDLAVALGAAYHAARLWRNGAEATVEPSVAPFRPDRQTGARPSPQAATSTPAPTVVTVAGDGSGDYTNLEKALADVGAGGMIRLLPGEYRLAKALVVEKAVHLVGAGMDATSVVGYFEPQVVRVTSGSSLQAEGVTFRHSGSTPADVLVAEDCELALTECRITGGVAGPEGDGDGLIIAGAAAARVVHCLAERNAGSGIRVRDQAQPTLDGNTCQGNKQAGIVYSDTAGGVARLNQCLSNELSGIKVSQQAQPTLEANTCQNNAEDGIVYLDAASGSARQNQCVENGDDGIQVSEQAQPTLEENTCRANKGVGIYYVGSAAGIAHQNQCLSNEMSGVLVTEQSRPTLEGNTCQENKQAGIGYIGAAAGVARQNQCLSNENSGIQVQDQAQPILEGNTCQGNAQDGIVYFDTASGSVRQNQCVENGDDGIQVSEQAQPTLEENTCRGNKAVGIYYVGSAAGTARGNQCLSNDISGILVAEQAKPTLEGNTCQENKKAGIGYIGAAAGVACQNLCLRNEMSGIQVQDQAQPTLEGNTCRGNAQDGIVYFDTASGSARRNQCVENGDDGIQVSEQAIPALEENTCRGNKAVGIYYVGSAAGTARGNHCLSNDISGILVAEQAKPTLERNICRGNKQVGIGVVGHAQPTLYANRCQENTSSGIWYYDEAGGVARQNQCIGNGTGGWFDGFLRGRDGIKVEGKAHPLLERNECSENSGYGIYVTLSAHPSLENNDCSGNSKGSIG